MFSKMNGCFDDLPCPSADVRAKFCEYIQSLRLHRLPEQQMLSSKTNEFYATTKYLTRNPEFSFTSLPYWQNNLPSNNTTIKHNSYVSVKLIEEVKRNVAFKAEISDNETQINFVNEQSIMHIWDKLIMYTNHIVNKDKKTIEKFKLRICNVDLLMHSSHGEFMLSLLLLGIANILHQSRKLHSWKDSTSSPITDMESKNGMVIELCVISNKHGKRVANLIQYYLETQCFITVIRTNKLSTIANVEIVDGTKNDTEEEEEEEREEWNMSSVDSYEECIDEVKSNVVDLHEQLYDELSVPGALLGVNKKQVILLILPNVSTLRKDIRHALADAYTSFPIQVREEREICKSDASSLHIEIPLVLMCSMEWLYEQTLLTTETTIFVYIHVSAIVFAKFVNHELTASNDIDNTSSSVDSFDNDKLVQEETNDMESIVLMLCNQKQLSHTFSIVICSETSSATLPVTLTHAYNENSSKSNALQWQLVQVNILLSLYRRFRLRNRRVSKLLYMNMHRHNFITERAWKELLILLINMHNAGIILADDLLLQANTKDNDINEVQFTLTPFGRLASATMKMQHNTLNSGNVELSVIDKKYLIWMFLFRQLKEKAMQWVRSRHTFNDWIDKAIETFYEAVNITFTNTESSSAHAFHNLCACFAQVGFITYIGDAKMALFSSPISERKELIDAEIFAKSNKNEDSNTNSDSSYEKQNTHNRVYELIVAPHGFRTRSGSDFGNNNNGYLPSNMCRGWEVPSSPLQQHGTSASEPQIWSLPTASLYCELLPYAKSTTSGVQCPVIYSQPIIILHSLLHISFHNACIFAEMESDVLQIPLPELLLQSPVFNMLLQSSSLSSLTLLEQNLMSNKEWWVDVYTSFVKAVPSANEMFSFLTLHNTHFVETCEHGSRKRERESSESELQRILSAQRDAAKVSSSKSGDNTKTFSGVQPRTPLEEEAITQFLKLVERVGREKAERAFRGKKGFAFIDPKHDLHPFYLYSLKKKQ